MCWTFLAISLSFIFLSVLSQIVQGYFLLSVVLPWLLFLSSSASHHKLFKATSRCRICFPSLDSCDKNQFVTDHRGCPVCVEHSLQLHYLFVFNVLSQLVQGYFPVSVVLPWHIASHFNHFCVRVLVSKTSKEDLPLSRFTLHHILNHISLFPKHAQICFVIRGSCRASFSLFDTGYSLCKTCELKARLVGRHGTRIDFSRVWMWADCSFQTFCVSLTSIWSITFWLPHLQLLSAILVPPSFSPSCICHPPYTVVLEKSLQGPPEAFSFDPPVVLVSSCLVFPETPGVVLISHWCWCQMRGS